MSAGVSAKGPRWYEWAFVHIADQAPGQHTLLSRRGGDGVLAFYRCWSPTPVPLKTLVRVAGLHWAVEKGFQAGKGQVSLDHYQVRTWTGWHRFITLAMLASAILMIAAAAAGPPPADPYHHARHNDRIPLTAAEIRRLFHTLLIVPLRAMTATVSQAVRHAEHWSQWRRRHQGQARRSHYQRRLTTELGT